MKRVLSLVLALVLVLGMMPTFAAGETGAEQLNAAGFISGSNGDLMVDKTLTRAEMAVVLSQLFGVKEAAEIYAAPANFTDVNDHWAKSYIAYGQEAGWLSGRPDGTYGPEDIVSSKDLASFVLNALGYNGDFDWATSPAFAATLGVNVGSSDALTRGAAFEAVWEVVNTPTKGSDVALGVQLGKIEPATPVATDLEVVKVYSDNLKQIFVEFNQDVDSDTATDVDNYTVKDGSSDVALQDANVLADGKTVVLTFKIDNATPANDVKAGQQDTYKVTVADVKSVDESKKVVKVTKEIEFLDTALPEILNAEVVGSSTIKVTFSEPVKKPAKADFKVNDGKFYVDSITMQKDNTEALVKLYSSLKTGDLPFEVKTAITDYAGFSAIGRTFTLDVTEDTTAPVVTGFKSAKETEVVLVWSEDLDKDSAVSAVQTTDSKYYHTNSSNYAKEVAIDGNEMTITFDTARKLAPGTTYVYVLKEAVKDLWGNKNTQQMTAVEVTLDKTAPVLTGVDYVDEKHITLEFDETVKNSTVETKNITLLDSDGKEVDNRISKVTTADAKEIKLSFAKDLDGDYAIVVEGVEDTSGNEIVKTTIPFTATDKQAPSFPGNGDVTFTTLDATTYVITIPFGEAMATEGTYSALDLAKYIIKSDDTTADGIQLDDIDDAVISLTNEGKTVEIRFPVANKALANDANLVISNAKNVTINIARVADDANNLTKALSSSFVTVTAATDIAAPTFKTIADDTVKVTFADKLTKFDGADFSFVYGGKTLVNSSITTDTNDDGNTVATIVFADKYADTTAFGGFASNTDGADLVLTVTTSANTVNQYGQQVTAGAVNSKDGIAPSLVQVDDEDSVYATDKNTIVLTFDEAINKDFLSLGTFSVSDRVVTGITPNAGGASGAIVTLTLAADTDYTSRFDLDGVSVTLNTPIEDVHGVELETLSTVVMAEAVPAFKAITLGNGGGTGGTLEANDTVVIEFTADVAPGTNTGANATIFAGNKITLQDGTVFTFENGAATDATGTLAWTDAKTATITVTAVNAVPTTALSGKVTSSNMKLVDATVDAETVANATVTATGTY